MKGGRNDGPGAWAPIQVLACASPAPDIRGTDQDPATAVTGPLHTYPAMWPNDDSAPALRRPSPARRRPEPERDRRRHHPQPSPARIDSSPTIRPPGEC